MRALTVLYDANCPMCTHAAGWLNAQQQLVQLQFVPAASEYARWRFPTLDHEATLQRVTVISDTGDVYRGAKAWVVVLWALKRYRQMAMKLSKPQLLPTVEAFVSKVSQYRPRPNVAPPSYPAPQ